MSFLNYGLLHYEYSMYSCFNVLFLYLTRFVTVRFPVFLSHVSMFRPPDIVCRRTYILPGFFLSSSFFFRQLISELAERNSTISGHMLGSKL